MGEFSATQNADEADCGCEQGNLFLADFPIGSSIPGELSFSINGAETGPLPTGEILRFPNTLAGTTSTLAVTVGNRDIDLIENLGDYNIVRPEDVGVYVGPLEVTGNGRSAPPVDRVARALELLRTYDMASPVTRTDQIERLRMLRDSGNGDNDTEVALNALIRDVEDDAIAAGFMDPVGGDEDIVMLEVPPSIEGQVGELECNIETASDSALRRVAIALACSMGVIDQATGAAGLAATTGGAVDFTIGGTGTMPLLVDLRNLLVSGEFKSFLRQVVKLTSGGRVVKIFRNVQGKLIAAFPGTASMRDILKFTGARLSVMGGAVKGTSTWRAGAKVVARGVPVLSYLIVGAIDVAEWMALPDEERTFAELAGQLIPDMAKIAISSIVGAGFMAVLAMGSLPALAIIAAGIGVAVLAGIALDAFDSHFGVTDAIKRQIAQYGTLESTMPRIQTYPVGQVSSARMPYQRGVVQAGHETNALDVMSDTANMYQ